MSDIEYIESTIKQLVEELKAKKCLSQEFRFLTKAERDRALERLMDDFISEEDCLDHQ